mgnify:CR=1 FL=1
MDKELFDKIRQLKKKYESDGFIILGVFGSFARGDNRENSDIDILYELKEEFYNRYPGFKIFPVIDEIEKEIQAELDRRVDLANKNALNEIGNKYILPEVIYV